MQSVDNAVTDVALATKKFFKRVLPIMLVMLVCNQLNRSNIGYAQEHLQADVGIGAAAYGFGAGLFFIAYAIFELPSNVMMEKYGAKVWLARIMISWGIVSFLMVFVQNETMFYALRFLLGAAEAGFFPAVIFYFARWVPAGQRGKATAIFIAGSSVAAALSGPIAGMLLSLHDVLGFRGWQWLFGFEGLLSVVVGIAVFFVLDAKIAGRQMADSGRKVCSHRGDCGRGRPARPRLGGNPSGKINRWIPALFAGVIEVLVPLRMDDLGASGAAIGALFLVAAAVEAIISPVAGRWSDRAGRLAPIRAGLIGAAVMAVLLPLPATAVLLGLSVVIAIACLAVVLGAWHGDAVGRGRGRRIGPSACLLDLEPRMGAGHILGAGIGGAIAEATSDAVPYGGLAVACVCPFSGCGQPPPPGGGAARARRLAAVRPGRGAALAVQLERKPVLQPLGRVGRVAAAAEGRQVSRLNWYLPRYCPPGETARGLPPDSHSAIALQDSRARSRCALLVRRTERLLNGLSPSAPRVSGPTMPSGTRSCLRWKRLTARSVCAPKTPSAGIPSSCWMLRTAGPRSPRLTTTSLKALAPPAAEAPGSASAGTAATASAASTSSTAKCGPRTASKILAT